ncbi:MAG TPA: DUF3488 and transglutaminase-like domain-containing protein [Nitriliruptorales bacterium]
MKRDLTLAATTFALMLACVHALSRVFSTGEWRAPVYVAIALALAIAAIVRALRLHVLLTVVLAGVALVTYVDVMHLPPGGGLIPASEEWRQFTTLLTDGLRQFRDELAPTLPFPGLVLIASLGAYVVTALVHELLVRFRKPGLAILPAAVLWTVPLAVPQPPGRTWPHALPFLAAAGLVLLLESDVDVAGWYRETAVPRLSSAGVLVGIAALGLAAVAPGLLPGYQATAWYEQVSTGGPPGYQPLVDVGDRLKLPAPRAVLEVTAPRPLYLRIAALDTFDGRSWRVGPAGVLSYSPADEDLTRGDRDFPSEVPLGPTQRIAAQVRVLDLRNIYVPVPYQPVRVTGNARDQMVYSAVGGFVATVDLQEAGEVNGRPVAGVVEGLEYGVVADLPVPEPEQVLGASYDPATVTEHLRLPPGFDFLPFRQLAQQAYEVRGAVSPIQKAFALQDHFIGPSSSYRYSTEVDSLLTDQGADRALHRFVFEEQVGYCEYYATAMAVMLRSTGVPARVAVGFLPGEVVGAQTGEDGSVTASIYEVTTDDAHAWVEVLQPGIGWLKFDPTPRSDGATLPPQPTDLDPLQTLAQQSELDPTQQPTPNPADPSNEFDDLPTPANPDGTPDGASGGGGQDRGMPLRLLALALVAGVGGTAVFQWRTRSHHPSLDPAERVLAAQRRVHGAARRYGVARRLSETGSEVARRWGDELRVDRETATRFAHVVEEAAFGGSADPSAGPEAEDLADRLVGSLRRSVPQQDRVLAPVRVPVETVRDRSRELLARVRGS